MTLMPEVARHSVQSWEIDRMGHMNVQFYVDRMSDGLAGLAVRVGLGPRQTRTLGAHPYARDLHVRFLRERRLGSPFYLRAGILDASEKLLRVYQEMVGTTSGRVAAAFTTDVELRDDASNNVMSFPEAVLKKASELRVERPQHGCPRGIAMTEPRAALTLTEAESMALLATYQARVQDTHCDTRGRLLPGQFMSIVSSGVANLLAQTRGSRHAPAAQSGGAALEYRYIYRRYPRAGDVLALRSGLTHIGNKTYNWCHWLFDLETGEAVASAEGVGIALDLDTRKVMAIPDAMRAQLEPLVIDNLAV